jgi:hypothetical protein
MRSLLALVLRLAIVAALWVALPWRVFALVILLSLAAEYLGRRIDIGARNLEARPGADRVEHPARPDDEGRVSAPPVAAAPTAAPADEPAVNVDEQAIVQLARGFGAVLQGAASLATRYEAQLAAEAIGRQRSPREIGADRVAVARLRSELQTAQVEVEFRLAAAGLNPDLLEEEGSPDV